MAQEVPIQAERRTRGIADLRRGRKDGGGDQYRNNLGWYTPEYKWARRNRRGGRNSREWLQNRTSIRQENAICACSTKGEAGLANFGEYRDREYGAISIENPNYASYIFNAGFGRLGGESIEKGRQKRVRDGEGRMENPYAVAVKNGGHVHLRLGIRILVNPEGPRRGHFEDEYKYGRALIFVSRKRHAELFVKIYIALTASGRNSCSP